MGKVKVRVNNIIKEFELNNEHASLKLEDVAQNYKNDFPAIITTAVVDNKLYELNDRINVASYIDSDKVKDIVLKDTTDIDGNRIYMRSLSFLFVIACRDVLSGAKVFIEHSISGGYYCTIKTEKKLDQIVVNKIKKHMEDLVQAKEAIYPIDMPTELAQKEFKKVKRDDKSRLLDYREYDTTRIYNCCNYIDYFFGFMVPNTSYIEVFDLKLFNDGIVLLGPKDKSKTEVRDFSPQYKLAKIYKDTAQWSNEQGIDSVVSLNEAIKQDQINEVILTVEAYQSREIANIANMIKDRSVKIIQIAAPSSSGKTSFANRLKIDLRVNGINARIISTDDYFVNREDTPVDENGDHDYESINALDLKVLNEDLQIMINGGEIFEKKFDFKEGKRILTGKKLSIDKNQPLIIEGIHALNPRLTSQIEDKYKFKIYLSVMTQINLDDHNRVPTTDLRLLRRIVRDSQFRNNSANDTLTRWASVRRGEDKYIFPFQEEADVIFNSSFMYEIAVLKKFAKPLLREISEDNPNFKEANRLLKILQYFVEIEDTSMISQFSILREFIGGSKLIEQ